MHGVETNSARTVGDGSGSRSAKSTLIGSIENLLEISLIITFFPHDHSAAFRTDRAHLPGFFFFNPSLYHPPELSLASCPCDKFLAPFAFQFLLEFFSHSCASVLLSGCPVVSGYSPNSVSVLYAYLCIDDDDDDDDEPNN